MALREWYQTAIELDKLYKVEGSGRGAEQISPNIWINSGSVDIYVSQSATEPAALSDMTLNSDDTAVSGTAEFKIIPNYIAVVQNSGISTEIVLSGLSQADKGAIS
jgi:hypothetical protein